MSSDARAAGPLAGVLVLAVTQYGAGPYSTLYLADLGADVITIEDPTIGGDVGRYVPPYAADGDSLFFQSFNRGKRSVTLNLRKPDGKALFHRLAARADVVFNNLRGDQPARLGVDYESLKAVNPAIVCTSLSGFGLTGPRRAVPGYDYLIQGLIGLMSLTGEPDGPPTKAGLSIIDLVTGINAALGTVSGVLQARRTGLGCDVDVSLMDSGLGLLNYVAAWHLNGGYEPQRLAESAHPSIVPSQVFGTADGHIVIMCQKDKFWQRFCELSGHPEWAQEERFATMSGRYANREALLPLIRAVLRTRTTPEWIACFGSEVPCAPVNTVAEALREPHVAAREMVVSMPHPTWGELKEVACPIKLTGYRKEHTAAPPLGADTDDVLRTLLGCSDSDIEALRADGVI